MKPYVPVREDILENLIRMAGNSIPEATITNALTQKQYQALLRRKESQIQTDFTKLFRKTQNKVVDAISEHYGLDNELKEIIASEVESLRHPMVLTMEQGIDQAISIGRKEAYQQLRELGTKAEYQPFNSKVREVFSERAENAVKQSIDTINEQLTSRLSDAYEKGWNSEKTARELQATMKGMEDKNLKTLTRTEMHSAKMQARQLSYQERGVGFSQWRTAGDDVVRGNDPRDEADHVVMDGEITPLDTPFSNGLLYPGDMSGDISEWINCRCDMRPFVMPVGMEAPGDGEPFMEEDLVPVDVGVSVSDVNIAE